MGGLSALFADRTGAWPLVILSGKRSASFDGVGTRIYDRLYVIAIACIQRSSRFRSRDRNRWDSNSLSLWAGLDLYQRSFALPPSSLEEVSIIR